MLSADEPGPPQERHQANRPSIRTVVNLYQQSGPIQSPSVRTNTTEGSSGSTPVETDVESSSSDAVADLEEKVIRGPLWTRTRGKPAELMPGGFPVLSANGGREARQWYLAGQRNLTWNGNLTRCGVLVAGGHGGFLPLCAPPQLAAAGGT